MDYLCGLPSAFENEMHKKKFVEQDANARAIKYFNNIIKKTNEDKQLDWNFYKYPVNNYTRTDDVINNYNYNNWLQSIFPF